MTRAVLFLLGLLAAMLARAADEHRIVSLAPNLTELAFAAGAGSRVVGTVEFSDEPAAAKRIPRVGDAFRVDIERILAIKPTLVLAWETGTPRPTVERLRALGLNVREFATQRVGDVPRVVRELGVLTDTQMIANAAASRFEQEMATLRSRYSQRAAIDVFLQVSSRPLYTVNAQQIMSELLTVCGARNVFADLNQLAPQISLESVIARDPQVVISTDDAEPNALAEWRKWPQVRAVRDGNLYSLPANDLTRASTRLPQGARALCEVLETARSRLK